MHSKRFICSALILAASVVGVVQAGDKKPDETLGQASITGRSISGARDAAKFEEYRDINNVSGDFLVHDESSERQYFEVKGTDIGEDDVDLKFKTVRHGEYTFKIHYFETPHRFAYDAPTLYSGVGSNYLAVPDTTQADLAAQANNSKALADKLIDVYYPGANRVDTQFFRKKVEMDLDIVAWDPLYLRINYKNEDRNGTRPIAGSFGFSNLEEIFEPIDYDTTEWKITAEYVNKDFNLLASYYNSSFRNSIDDLIWENPFRVADGTAANAYTSNTASGPKIGRIDLAPNNDYDNFTGVASFHNLPLDGHLVLKASVGEMEQNDQLLPYTTNGAIVTGAIGAPFDAFNVANLPRQTAQARVTADNYDAVLTLEPSKKSRVKVRHRIYDRRTETAHYSQEGYVRTDAVWEEVPQENENLGFRKETTQFEYNRNISDKSSIGVGYTNDRTKRQHREVHVQDNNIYKISATTKISDNFDATSFYERSTRNGEYDPTVPFGHEYVNAQLPFLRKYDEARVEGDRYGFSASGYFERGTTANAYYEYNRDDYIASSFGLRDVKNESYGLDISHPLSNDRVLLSGYYNHEKSERNQASRQWNPKAAGDPYYTDLTEFSTSNWTADDTTTTDTFGVAANWVMDHSRRTNLDADYTWARANGQLDFTSPLGTTDNNKFLPAPFGNVSDSKRQVLNFKLKHEFSEKPEGWFGILGYMYENLRYNDFNRTGYTNVPTTLTGTYNGALLADILPKSYNANVVYASAGYRF